jgi:hypothetical protein
MTCDNMMIFESSDQFQSFRVTCDLFAAAAKSRQSNSSGLTASSKVKSLHAPTDTITTVDTVGCT